MAASQTELLLTMLDCLLATRETADALFALAVVAEAKDPDEAKVLRSIGRAHRVRVLLLEARLVALQDVQTDASQPSLDR